jgi:hypothetical protein
MRTLPTMMIRVLATFAPLFSKRLWRHVQILLAGAILAPGKRNISSTLRAMGLEQEKNFHDSRNRQISFGIRSLS